ERLLQRVQLAVARQAFDRRQLAAVGLDRQDGAGLHRAAVEVDRARPADGCVAADLRPGEPEVVAEVVDEQRPGLDLRLVPDAVDGERNGYQRVPPLRRAPLRT